ncbi:MAG: sugar phosphate isomerase/epimerase [Chitinophagaceae bacterium]|nr:MAG: sugar phosphate isomerase/epimerase [Chitinophagaceae bacterium]
MKRLLSIAFVVLFAASCGDSSEPAAGGGIEPQKDWKFGIALWTFHDVDLPASLNLVDSAGLLYIEPNTFHKSGQSLGDTLLGRLSATGLAAMKKQIADRGLVCESVYVVGDSTLSSWVAQFEIAKALGASFVTTEPPVNMLSSIDSIAGVYGIKVAIHDHWKGVSAYWHPDSTLKALEGHPNFGVCADVGHFPKSGVDPVNAIKQFSGRLLAIHLKDIAAANDPTLKDVRAGKGIIDFPAIFNELKAQQFKGNIYIERDSIEPGGNLKSVRETITWYNDQLSRLR